MERMVALGPRMEARKEGWKIWKKGGVELVGLKGVVKESLREAGLCSPRTAKERGSTNYKYKVTHY